MKQLILTTLILLALLSPAARSISEFDLQTKSGQLWPDIVAYRADAVKEVEARATKAEAKAKRYDDLLSVAQTALESGNLSALKALLETKVEDEKQTEKERQIADLEAQKVQADADAAKRKDEIDVKIAAIQNDEPAAPAEVAAPQ